MASVFAKDVVTAKTKLVAQLCSASSLVGQSQQRNVDAAFYKEVQRLDLRTYDNLLMFRVTLSLGRGKRKRMKEVNAPYIIEEQKGRGLL